MRSLVDIKKENEKLGKVEEEGKNVYYKVESSKTYAISRWWYGEGRHQTIKYLDDDSPTTIVYPKVTGMNQVLYGKNESIAIRLVKDNFCKELINQINAPLISTSANISGKPFPKKFQEIDKKIINEVDYVVNFDDSNLKNPKPSRIIKVSLNGQIEIIRE